MNPTFRTSFRCQDKFWSKNFALWFVRNAESCPNLASNVFLEAMSESYLLKPGGHFASLNGHHARQSLVEILLNGGKSQAYRELSSELLFRCTRIHGPNEPEIGFLTSFRWRVLYMWWTHPSTGFCWVPTGRKYINAVPANRNPFQDFYCCLFPPWKYWRPCATVFIRPYAWASNTFRYLKLN